LPALIEEGKRVKENLYLYLQLETRINIEFAKVRDQWVREEKLKEKDPYELQCWQAKWIRAIHKIIRCFYVSFYYYLMPFAILFVSLYVMAEVK